MTEVRVTDPVTGGQKGTKPERFDLIPWDALEEVARVYGVGAEKYEADNYLKGYKWRLSFAALVRHIAKAMIGEDRDPETGCLHLAHAAWHCLTLITFFLRGLGTDDRAKVAKVNLGPVRVSTAFEAQNPKWDGNGWPATGEFVRVRYETQVGQVTFVDTDPRLDNIQVKFEDNTFKWFPVEDLCAP